MPAPYRDGKQERRGRTPSSVTLPSLPTAAPTAAHCPFPRRTASGDAMVRVPSAAIDGFMDLIGELRLGLTALSRVLGEDGAPQAAQPSRATREEFRPSRPRRPSTLRRRDFPARGADRHPVHPTAPPDPRYRRAGWQGSGSDHRWGRRAGGQGDDRDAGRSADPYRPQQRGPRHRSHRNGVWKPANP